MATKKLDFATTEKIDVTQHIEKKGRFSYLSWPFAVSELRKAYPEGYWRVQSQDNGSPCILSEVGAFVSVTVYLHKDCPGFTQIHPVFNHQNKPILKPGAFDINTSIQRCLVKAIALATGIGLHIYAGEDLPPAEVEPHLPPLTKEEVSKLHYAIYGSVDIDTLGLIWKQDVNPIRDRVTPEQQAELVEAKDKREAELQEALLGGPEA